MTSAPARRSVRTRLAGLSIRARLMLIGLAGLAGALVIGGVLLYTVLTTSLGRSVEGTARASAEQVALFVDSGQLPDPVPVSGSQVVQVLDAAGRVVTASVTADRLTALVTPDELRRALAGERVSVPGSRSGLAGRLLVAAVGAGPSVPSGRQFSVVAAAPTADVEQSAATLRTLLLWIFPLLLAVLAVIAWRVIGAAFAPVEALRRGAERIDESSSETERLPVPPTRDEISALATTLNAMLERVTAARHKQRAFVADAAHELRSPLASMRTQLEVAERLGEGGDLPAELLADVDRLTTLVDDLLLLARADDAATTRRTSDLDVGQLVSDVARRYAHARVPVRTAPGLAGRELPTRAASADLTRALTNLVDNAVRHARTSVVLDATAVGHQVQLTVTDDGHGIPAEDRERVFDRFTRLDEARDRDSGGSGLGLPITRALLRRTGGDVRLEDAAPGLRAVVRLPRAG
ncbi:sensor histidine kinase [Intrasporangium calvum]|uniref:histidine kinase n=1 Tax=Intrasporangium calvum (strain ATCC 23552 / DSM 43043 / JCM 3097 / NBRC 12989 / NCIMB 10167 / NRRL B-3866 / 7 KIP) TaxID=710696 RepID=E6SBN2_INTC7|nr:HAMP domain-containing sensor histidine kinase [Intrasporangium calvum]ADU47363.1 integral membrane sensor signal transduction histidine kinase [Intrasporangium calvum DSM 43043]